MSIKAMMHMPYTEHRDFVDYLRICQNFHMIAEMEAPVL